MKVGSLFTGYGGLDLAVGGDMAWYSEINSAACTVLKSHYPDVVNIGDITEVDWSTIEPVDVITGGYPCQPFSTAGKRKGENDERHLWPYVREAIRVLGPRLVVLENVRGHLTLGFSTVLGEIADLGYSARWGVVRASDAGAPHRRERLFIIAYPNGESFGHRQSRRLDTKKQRTREQGYASKNLLFGFSSTNNEDEKGNDRFGPYSSAVERWEQITNRAAPEPVVVVNGKDKLNPIFVEWMMGLPEGWVTGHGLSLSQELKMLGNGVVPQQAQLALKVLGSMS